MENLTERDLVLKYKRAKDEVELLKEASSRATLVKDKAESALIDLLTSKDAKSTAKYVGLGHATLAKPRLFARYNKENEGTVFSFLREQDRADLIKQTVNAQSLSTFVKDRIGDGNDIPEFLPYFMKQSIKFFTE